MDETESQVAKFSPSALAEMYRAYSGELFAYLLVQTRHRESAEDLLQQLFLNLAKRGAGVLDAKAFLFRSARNMLINEWKADRRRTFVMENLVLLPKEGAVAADPERLPKLALALGALNADQREIIALRFFSGLSFREMEILLEAPKSTLHEKYEKALALMKKQLSA